jgi:hypothetical protein
MQAVTAGENQWGNPDRPERQIALAPVDRRVADLVDDHERSLGM